MCPSGASFIYVANASVRLRVAWGIAQVPAASHAKSAFLLRASSFEAPTAFASFFALQQRQALKGGCHHSFGCRRPRKFVTEKGEAMCLARRRCRKTGFGLVVEWCVGGASPRLRAFDWRAHSAASVGACCKLPPGMRGDQHAHPAGGFSPPNTP